jgi:imidazoleglycerol-phosphate dehydratase/histidinol-phosphatase
MKKHALIDRDGTLIFEPQDTYQIDSLNKLQILPGVIVGLRALQDARYTLIMVSNQDGLGTKSFPMADLEAPQQKMLDIFRKNGITFSQIFVCPHFTEDNCACRKPKTGLLDELLAKTRLGTSSFVCGDRESDRLLAENIGVRFLPMGTNGDFYKAVKPILEVT